MKTTNVRRFFPESEAVLIHQNGEQLSDASKGVEIILRTRENETEPCCAEVISGELYAEIGLTFDGKELTDYDGVFSLPSEIGVMLTELGYLVSEDFFA